MDWFDEAKELRKQGKEMREISEILKISYDTIRKRFYRENLKAAKNMLTISKTTEAPRKTNKILIVNDPHIPFHKNRQIIETVKKHKNETSAIVFGGDFFDCYDISSYPSINRYPLENEIIEGIDLLNNIKEITNARIIIIKGNHEKRLETYIAKMHSKGINKFIDPNILNMLTKGFTLYENDKETIYKGVKDIEIINNWYANINNELIVCHPTNFSKIEGKNAKTAIEHFIDKGENFSTVVVAHTHHQGVVPNYLGKMGIESGCMCEMPDNADYTKARTGTKTQENGYVLVSFDDKGKVNKNETKLYTLETEKKQRTNITIDF